MDVTRCALRTESRAPGGRTNAYLLGNEPAMLVDPAARTDELDELVRTRDAAHVLVTHTHPDHVGAVDAYAEETGATVWARRGFEDRFEAMTGVTPDRSFENDTTIDLGSAAVRLVDVPGHAPDHVAVVTDDGPICCGDCAVRKGSVVVGGDDGDMQAYLDSLRRLRAFDPPLLLPGHGQPIEDPGGVLTQLIRHREERERRVLEAVNDGARDVEAVLDRAYTKDLSGVRDLARATVVAHLEKLGADGAIDWDGEHAVPR